MKKLTSFLLMFFLCGALHAQIYIPTFDLQGHRGARGLMPENSIPGFLVALDSGVTTVELDLVISEDKRVVVSHDHWMSSDFCLQPDGSAISEQTEKSFKIYEMDYEEIRQFDCGSKGNAQFPNQLRIKTSKPLLKEVMIAVEHRVKSNLLYEVDYNMEIKSSPAGDDKLHPKPDVFSDLVYNLVDQYIPLERLVIQSFDFRVLQYWHEKYPTVRLSALISNTETVDANLRALGFKPAVYSPSFRVLTKEKVDYLKKLGIRVVPWTVNEVDDMKRMLEWKVDGFITDYPDRAAALGLGIRR